MIKYTLAIMALLIMTGCNKEPELVVKNKYVYEKPYDFSTIDLDGVYIDLKTKEIQKLCSPALVELNTMYKGVVEFYTSQIRRYREDRYNDKSGHKTGN